MTPLPTKMPWFLKFFLKYLYCIYKMTLLLFFEGVDILTAKEQLGHADIKMTMQVYTHPDKIHKCKSMSKLNDFINNQGAL